MSARLAYALVCAALSITGCGAKAGGGGESSSEGGSSGTPPTSSETSSAATTSATMTTTSVDGTGATSSDTTEGFTFDVGGMAESGEVTGEPPEFDCNDIPELPVLVTVVRTVYGAEDIEFDALGNLVVPVRGQNALFLYPREGDPVLLNPNIGLASTTGCAVLPDGDIVVADEGQPVIARVDPDSGQVTPIPYGSNGLSGSNGLTVGTDGMMYAASYGSGVLRIDPDSGEAEVLYAPAGGFGGIDGITFDPDYAFLYFNEGEIFQQGDGSLFRGTFDDGVLDEVEDLGPPLAGTQGTIDGMTSDVCGNIYIATQNVNSPLCAGSSTIRVSPDNEVEIVACLGNAAFTPSLSFGSGVGGWERDHLYVIDWGGEVYELPVGVPGMPLPHL